MKWIIDGKEFEDAREAAEYIVDDMSDDVYDDMLDECYGEIEICGYSHAECVDEEEEEEEEE